MMKTIVHTLSVEQVRQMLLFVGEEVINSKPLLTEIDSAIGDGDHGIGMEVGFTAANKRLRENEFTTINELFKTIGMSMINSMGGASGVIFGTMFAGGVKKLSPIEQLNVQGLVAILEAALQAIKDRGKASLGDKTMIDALEPAVISLQSSASQSNDFLQALRQAEESAKQGVENTKQYVSRFGRSKSLGERAIGHQDAGATSVSIIFTSMRRWVETELTSDE